MTHLGDIYVGEEINFKFTTVGTTGAPTQLAGTPSISVYRDNSLVQDTAGITLSVDFDGVTGLNNVNITTVGNPSFYYDRASYSAVIAAGTVGGTSVVGYVVAQWKMRQTIAEQVWGASVGSLGGVSDSFASAVAEMWSKIGAYIDASIASRAKPGDAMDLVTDAVDADAVAASGVAEITSGLATSANQTIISGQVSSLQSGVHVSSIADGILTFAKFAQNFWDGITTYVWAQSVGALGGISDSFASAVTEIWSRVGAYLDVAISTRLASSSYSVSAIASAVWEESVLGHVSGNKAGKYLYYSSTILGEFAIQGSPTTTSIQITGGSLVDDFYNDTQVVFTSGILTGQIRIVHDYVGATGTITFDEPTTNAPAAGDIIMIRAAHAHSATQIASFVWDRQLSEHLDAGSTGAALNAAASGASSPDQIALAVWGYSVGLAAPVSDSFAQAVAEIWSKSHRAEEVWDVTLSAHLSAGSTGFSLNAAGSAGDPWGTSLPGAYGAGTAGNILGNRLDVAVSSRLAGASYTAPDNATIAVINVRAADIQSRIPSALIGGRIASHVEAISDGLLSATKFDQSYWDSVQTYVWTASVGQYFAVSDSVMSAIADLWSRVDVNVSTRLASSAYTAPTAAPSAADVANAVWDEALAGHLSAGSTGAALNVSAGASSPDQIASAVWGASVGAFYSVSDSFAEAIAEMWARSYYLDASISSRMATFSYTAPLDAAGTRAAIGMSAADLDTQLVALAALIGAVPTSVQNADALLARNIAGGSNGGRTVAEAMYKLRNKLSINQATNILTVFGTDDTTPAWTEQLSVDAAAVPIVGSDPV